MTIAISVMGNDVKALPGIYDQLSYNEIANRLLAGHGFSFASFSWPYSLPDQPTAFWSFLYSLYLAGTYAVFGYEPLVARVIQAAITGFLTPLFTYRIAKFIFGERVALIAAGLSAIYLYFVYYAGALMTEPFYIVCVLWTLDCSLRLTATPHGRRWSWVELGVAIGLAVLLRQAYLLFVPVLYLWILYGSRQLKLAESLEGFNDTGNDAVSSSYISGIRWVRKPLSGLFISTVVVLVLIMPWTIRNYLVFGDFVLLNTNAGFAFFWGNHPIYGTVFQGVLPSDGPTYYELIPPELRSLNEAALDRALLARGFSFIAEDPGRIALLSISRIREYFKFWPSAESSLLSNVARVASFGVALPFMIAGLWLAFTSTWKTRTSSQKQGIVLLILFAAVYSLIHLLTWALIRYRLPVDAVMLIFAALALERAVAWLTHHKSYQRPQIL